MKNLTVVALALMIVFYGCKKEDPVPIIDVDFSSHVVGTVSPCKVEFNTITEGDHYEWNFDGQANTSFERNPVVTFENPGTYEVTLMVSGKEGAGKATYQVIIPPRATHFKINIVALHEYPLRNPSGGSWDPSPYSAPDIYFTILGLKPAFTSLYKHEARMQDVTSVKTITYTIPNGLTLPIADDYYALMVYDWDEFGGDIMGHIAFNPWLEITKKGGYPNSFTLYEEGCSATFNVTWQ